MKKIRTYEEAMARIEELEAEINDLRAENLMLSERSLAGRKKHDGKWMASYNDFAVKYESGKTIMEIVNEGVISRRTAYRYLAYYRELHKSAE